MRPARVDASGRTFTQRCRHRHRGGARPSGKPQPRLISCRGRSSPLLCTGERMTGRCPRST
ncbi:hypothetical protein HMPREF0043_00587 [Actinobaculum sp. oral taxon 183 str. F0552]|nr:hypothetical protein HMPREF0043_00587 [Actinobaculum sp. oral taxon 183 str. F0552]